MRRILPVRVLSPRNPLVVEVYVRDGVDALGDKVHLHASGTTPWVQWTGRDVWRVSTRPADVISQRKQRMRLDSKEELVKHSTAHMVRNPAGKSALSARTK